MCLKTDENLDIQDLTVRIVLNTPIFRILSLLSKEAIFLAVFMKNEANP